MKPNGSIARSLAGAFERPSVSHDKPSRNLYGSAPSAKGGDHAQAPFDRRPRLLSRLRPSVVGDSRPRPTSNAASGSSTATRNSQRSRDATIPAPAAPRGYFKKCCLTSGRMDGSNRDDFFQGLKSAAPSARSWRTAHTLPQLARKCEVQSARLSRPAMRTPAFSNWTAASRRAVAW
jgi:hypothetical protein